MIGRILLGAVGGFVGARLLSRLGGRCGGGGGGHCGGDRHSGGWRGRGFRGGFGGGGPRRIFFMLRELDLDRAQREVVREVMQKVGRAIADVGIGMKLMRFGAFADVADVLGGDTFDRAAITATLDRHAHAAETVRQEIVDGLARLHEVLRPEQRARLRELLASREGGFGPPHHDGHHDGPYR